MVISNTWTLPLLVDFQKWKMWLHQFMIQDAHIFAVTFLPIIVRLCIKAVSSFTASQTSVNSPMADIRYVSGVITSSMSKYCDMLPKSLKAGISEAALFTRQRTRRTITTQRTSATHLVGSFSVATELLAQVSSIPAAKTLLKTQCLGV
jgi:hypothetical protein